MCVAAVMSGRTGRDRSNKHGVLVYLSLFCYNCSPKLHIWRIKKKRKRQMERLFLLLLLSHILSLLRYWMDGGWMGMWSV